MKNNSRAKPDFLWTFNENGQRTYNKRNSQCANKIQKFRFRGLEQYANTWKNGIIELEIVDRDRYRGEISEVKSLTNKGERIYQRKNDKEGSRL